MIAVPETDRATRDTATATDEVRVRTYDEDLARLVEPRFDLFPDREKLQVLRALEPERDETVSNTTCVGLDEARALALDQSRTVDDKADRIGVGNGGAGGTAYANRSLNSPLETTDIVEYEVAGTQIIMDAYLSGDTEDTVGSLLSEMSVVSEQGRQFIHATFTEFEHLAGQGVQLEATLIFEPEGGTP